MTISLGDLLAIAVFLINVGISFAVLRQHGRFIEELRLWKHREVTPMLLDLKLRVGLLEGEDSPPRARRPA